MSDQSMSSFQASPEIHVRFSVESGSEISRETLGRELLRGVSAIEREQLHTGEIASYRRGKKGDLEYRRSPFISAFVYDALGYFDPRSPWFELQTLDVIPDQHRHHFLRVIARIRQQIRSFIAWQEEPNGLWRFFGRGSGLDPDADTTACAASVFLDSTRSGPAGRWRNHVNTLGKFRSTDGIYFTWISHEGYGYSWMDEYGRLIAGFDRVVNANVLRYLALAGEDVTELTAYLLNEAASEDLHEGSPYYPNVLSFFYMLARAWRQPQLPGLSQLSSSLILRILSHQAEDGDFGGALMTAFALSALLDLQYMGPPLEKAKLALFRKVLPWGGWGYQDFFSDRFHGYGSPAWTTALSMAVLARSNIST